MDIDRLRRQRQLNVQEQNALAREAIAETSRAFRAGAPHLEWVRLALVEALIDPERGILVSASSTPRGSSEETGYALWLTEAGRFYAVEAAIELDSLRFISVELCNDITASTEINQHKPGTGKTTGAIAREVLAEVSGANNSLQGRRP